MEELGELQLAADWEPGRQGEEPGRAQFKFYLGEKKKKQHFCGLRWLRADISKFLPMAVSHSWKNLFGQPSPGLVTKSGYSKMELRDRGSFISTRPRAW